ncbi:hypothetical protein [Actinomadura sp. 3N508]|uniref:hypothetical protein n=1 Tax=Actinomadura sp. 3N508 TaxID=3375153 RepID=UPI0037B8B2E0
MGTRDSGALPGRSRRRTRAPRLAVHEFYRREEFAVPVPLLWIYARATKDVGMVVSVLATSGGTWGYHEAQFGRHGYLCLCGDAQAAAAQVDRLLKHRLFPSTW